MSKLTSLLFWTDTIFRPPAEQMALDEALFDEAISSGTSILRCYGWDRPAITLGYFSSWQYDDREETSVRRWTGGGRVEHGKDLTFALAIPSTEPLAKQPSSLRYAHVHSCLMRALSTAAIPTSLNPGSDGEQKNQGGPSPCFVTPVDSDLLDSKGEKIAGGAQRRVAGAILHQGSIRLPLPHRAPAAAWIRQFCDELSENTNELSAEMEDRALSQIEPKLTSRYALTSWNRRR